MKNTVIGRLGLWLSVLLSGANSVSADAVISWNENVAGAAEAACVHASGNGLAGDDARLRPRWR